MTPGTVTEAGGFGRGTFGDVSAWQDAGRVPSGGDVWGRFAASTLGAYSVPRLSLQATATLRETTGVASC